jgi:predicted CopG family antitoxin
MAVKTITIDMEAYDLLAADKKGNESFSQVIKRRFRPAKTAAHLLSHLDEMILREDTLEAVESLVSERDASTAHSPVLDGE